ncbi:hypothetical protein FS749_012859, partial [Ceratobasidium sp. UAMH 11750]
QNHIAKISHNHASPAINTTLNSVLGEWKTARTLLAASIQSYRAACVTLITACAKPMHCPSERSDLEELLVVMNSELESLVSDENALREM